MEYDIEYTSGKSILIAVKDGHLVVKAPRKVKQETIDEALKKHRLWISRRLNESEIKKQNEELLTPERIKSMKTEAREYLSDKTEHYSKIMHIKYGRITITSAKTRLGSCSSSGNISYSYRLMLYPEPAREYVVVHELAHLFEMNHSPKFYSIIERVLPDYKERKKLLKSIPLIK